MFDDYLERWELEPDGPPIVTRAARLLPVRRHGEAAMLRIATHPEAMTGGVLMIWWEGRGAARVLASDEGAILLERAQGSRSLSDMARSGEDDAATGIICDVIAELHAPRAKPLPDLIALDEWFQALEPTAASQGGALLRAAETARRLLASQRDIGALHGDIHHDNILDFGERGWLAIDPNRLGGDRCFDYANLFCNPDIADSSISVATLPDRFRKRLDIVATRAGLDRPRLLDWIIAYTGLSAAWLIGDGENPHVDMRILELALAERAQ